MPLGPPNLAPTAARFSTPVTHRRWAEPTVTSEGLLADPAPTDTTGRAHHWPEPGVTMERLPEGLEGQDVRAGTTSLDLRTVEDGEVTRSDSLVWAGVEYTVVSTRPRAVNAAGVVTWREFVMVRRA
jgi:hypothetical protein